jgi:hypothetical protein
MSKEGVADKRFAAIQSDPRFSRPRRKDIKVPIDNRFKAAFRDKDFIDQRILPQYSADNSECGQVWTETQKGRGKETGE